MMERKTLIYLSDCGADRKGAADPFLLLELPWLQERFDRIGMVSHPGVADLTNFPAKGSRRIALSRPGFALCRAWLKAPFAGDFWRELARLARDRRLRPQNVVRLFRFTLRGIMLHLWLEALLRPLESSSVLLYAFWMNYEAYAASLSRAKHPNLRLVVRGHAFDIDPARNPLTPYLMKRRIAQTADSLAFISRDAMTRYLRYMEGMVPPDKLRVVPLGSGGGVLETRKEPPFFSEGRLRLVSCSAIHAIKQLPVLVDALSAWEGAPPHWLHMGGGPGEASLRAYAEERLAGKGLTYRITGWLDSGQIQRTYETRAFDVFVNTSRLEGVPVSIMEAMRFGIPVIAPRVGGIPELVDDAAGILYEPEEGAAGLTKALRTFAALPRERIEAMREAAQSRWNRHFRSEALLPLLFGDAPRIKNAPPPAREEGQASIAEPKRILLVSYLFAPQNAIGAVRATKLAKYLSRLGHEVTVLCGEGLSALADPTLSRDLLELKDVRQVREWNPIRTLNRRRQAVAPPEAPASGAAGEAPQGGWRHLLKDRLYLMLRHLADRSFTRMGLKELRRMNRRFDAVISSYGPLSSHWIGCRVKKLGMAKVWVADFRDPVAPPLPWMRWLPRRYLRDVIRHADRITGVSRGYLAAMELEGIACVIPNGFDREDVLGMAPPGQRTDGCLHLAYCGQMYGGQRDLRPLFRSLKELMEAGVLPADRLRLDYAGKARDSAVFGAQAAEYGLRSAIRDHGMLSRDQALQLQMAADVILVAAWNTPEQQGNLPGKLLEVLMLERPVICCTAGTAAGSAAARLIRETGAGCCYEEAEGEASQAELTAYVKALCLAFAGGEPPPLSPDPDAREAYAYPNIALAFDALVNP